MATEAQARQVLKHCAERLRKLGAHGLSVGSGAPFGRDGPVIRALRVPGADHALPKTVSATIAGRRIRIPVHIEDQERFQAEAL